MYQRVNSNHCKSIPSRCVNTTDLIQPLCTSLFRYIQRLRPRYLSNDLIQMQSTRGTIIISTSMIMLGDRKPTLTWLLLYLFFIIFGSFLNIVGRYVSGSEGATYRTNPLGFAQRVGLSGPTTENPPPRQMRRVFRHKRRVLKAQ